MYLCITLGPTSIAYKKVSCIGLENGLSNCFHDNSDDITCNRSSSASVVCTNSSTLDTVSVRLIGSVVHTEGILQLYFANEWGGVCINGWTLRNADVLCRQLGLGIAISTYGVAIPTGQRIQWLSGVHCNGKESNITECFHLGWGYATSTCYHGNSSVWIKCSGKQKVTFKYNYCK